MRIIEDSGSLVYVGLVLLLGLWAYVRTWRALRLHEQQRREDLAAREDDDLEAIHSRSHEVRLGRDTKSRAAASIGSRFTVHRRVLLPLVMGVTLLLASLPFMSAIPATTLSVVIAIITLVLGVAARPMLENAFAGLMMSLSKVIRVGDTVRISGWYGSIEDISVTHTTVRIWDGKRFVLPNSVIIQKEIVNYSLFDQRLWASVEFWVAWDTNIGKIRKLATEAAEDSPHFLNIEPPTVWVISTEKDAVGLWIAAWAANSADAWTLSEEIRTRLIETFQKHNIRTHDVRATLREDRPANKPVIP